MGQLLGKPPLEFTVNISCCNAVDDDDVDGISCDEAEESNHHTTTEDEQ